jgi:hypothetical protein
MDNIKRYEVRYEDSNGFKWYRGKESGVIKYEDAKLCANNLKDKKNIKIVEVTENYKVVETI